MVKMKQNRSRKSGHKQSLNVQDYGIQTDSRATVKSNLSVMLCLLQSRPMRDVFGGGAEAAIREIEKLLEVVK
jgi:hypothetical protein